MTTGTPVVEPDLRSGPARWHLVGIGGAGMSGIASLLDALGHQVAGSDQRESSTLARLRHSGVDAREGADPTRVGGADWVAASSAVPAGDVELVEARRLGIPVLSRADVLAALCALRPTLAVAGTKGKTTTTAMLAAILGGVAPGTGYLVGGDLPGAGGGARWAATDGWFVVEADESDGTFLRLPASAGVVTGVEADHLDYYGDMAGLRAAFARFTDSVRGPVVIGVDTIEGAALAAGRPSSTTYGTGPSARLRAVGVVSGRSDARFEVERDGVRLGELDLAVPGVHNVRNACGALAMALEVGVSFADAAEALARFRPVARRFEWRGGRDGWSVVDDYAHLPSALEVVVATARAGGWGRVIAVFQPHLYSRTAALHAELGAALAGADLVVVTDVYGAREAPRAGVDGRLVADAARRAGAEVRYVPHRAELAGAVGAELRPGDLVLTLGAGDITTLADELFGSSEP